MNQHDRDNLNFILSLDENGFERWYSQLSIDDMDYAIELLQMARTEVAVEHAKIFDEVEDTTEAMGVLKGFML